MSVRKTAEKIAGGCVGYRVRMLSRVLSRLYDQELRPHGLRFSQMNILTTVVLLGPVPAAEIGRALALEKSTLSRNLRLMEEKGWVGSEPGGGGTGRLLQVTRKGERLLEKAAPAWQTAQDAIEELLGEAGSRAIRRAANRLLKV